MPEQIIPRAKAIQLMRKAHYTARLFSKDPRKKVACIFVSPKSFATLAESWNGFVRGWSGDTPETWANREATLRAPVRHAERNAIDFSARHGVALEGAICISTFMPCRECCASLAQVGVSAIITMRPNLAVTKWAESIQDSLSIIEDLKIPLMMLEPDEVVELPALVE